ncbi:hypothetical protein [Roseivivax sediminis]|uniref:Uncharacterized protein n=1 Tax=Roseivivax sediminis TaxID=936889 RepID=A0A1I1U9M5_9RHOB|nr:hypothetical protein [Roseivivax sediminis]SFD67556.1 hypothetical protein SAMN04515678_102232 [Roseivivax sediminis]
MEVLSDGSPKIEPQRFTQAGLSDDFWSVFLDIVRLSLAIQHWSGERKAIEKGYTGFHDAYARRQARRSQRREIEARREAAKKIRLLGRVATTNDERGLFASIAERTKAIVTPDAYMHADYRPTAIYSFDGQALSLG